MKINKLFYTPLLSRALCHGILPNSSLKKPKPALLRSRAEDPAIFFAPP